MLRIQKGYNIPKTIILSTYIENGPSCRSPIKPQFGVQSNKKLGEIIMLIDYIKAHMSEERGASLVEYALLVALIAVVCIVAVTTLGGQVNNSFDTITTQLASTTTA